MRLFRSEPYIHHDLILFLFVFPRSMVKFRASLLHPGKLLPLPQLLPLLKNPQHLKALRPLKRLLHRAHHHLKRLLLRAHRHLKRLLLRARHHLKRLLLRGRRLLSRRSLAHRHLQHRGKRPQNFLSHSQLEAFRARMFRLELSLMRSSRNFTK